MKLMEINPRAGGSLLALSETTDERNVLRAELQLTEGVNPGCPEIDSTQNSLYAWLCKNMRLWEKCRIVRLQSSFFRIQSKHITR